jgi:hypothetical protein
MDNKKLQAAFKKWKTVNKEKVSEVAEIFEEIKPKGLKEAFPPTFKDQVLYTCFRASQYRNEDHETEDINNQRRRDLKGKIPSQIKPVEKILENINQYPETGSSSLKKSLEGYKKKLEDIKNSKGWGFAGLIYNKKLRKNDRDRWIEYPAGVSLWYHLVYHFRNYTSPSNKNFKLPGIDPEVRQVLECSNEYPPAGFPKKKDIYRIQTEGQTMPTNGVPCYPQVVKISNKIFTDEPTDYETVKKQVENYEKKDVLLTAWELP